jgi:hypothetical protein
MKAQNLPESQSNLTEWVNRNVHSKADLTGLSVSCQVLVSELFEDIELQSSQITSIGLPQVRDTLDDLEIKIQEACAQCFTSGSLDSSRMEGSSDKLKVLVEKISDLARARGNMESVRSLLQQS